MVRHYTLSDADLAMIRRCRGDHNRLGYALMLCYLRYPGRPLRADERPPAALVAFVAEQIDVCAEASIDAISPRAEPPAACCRTAGPASASSVRDARRRRTGERGCCRKRSRTTGLRIWPSWSWRNAGSAGSSFRRRARSNGSASTVRYQARREIERRLTDGLSAEQRRRLDALTQRRAETGQSWLAWLRQMPEATKPAAMLGLIERLDHVRAIGIDPARGHRVHQARLAQLAREAGRTTAQHIAGYERQRRHATLVAISAGPGASLTDQAIDLFDRLVGTMFRKAEGRHARAFQADARAINEKVRLYARVGAALIAAREAEQDAFEAIAAVIPWERFRATVAEAEALARPEEFDAYQSAGRALRRHPALVAGFPRGVRVRGRAGRRLADARHRDAARDEPPAASTLPKSAPTGFVRQRWARHVLPGGAIDRRYYELCVLSELRDRLRAGDVWVVGSRRYRSFEERLISQETLRELQADRHPAGRGRCRFRALHCRAAGPSR